jgi:ribosomal protein L40E
MIFQKDELLKSLCLECGNRSVKEFSKCPKCKSDILVNETYHEGIECHGCGHIFEAGEGGYVDEEDNLFCIVCGTN